jgi:hypothetical protein
LSSAKQQGFRSTSVSIGLQETLRRIDAFYGINPTEETQTNKVPSNAGVYSAEPQAPSLPEIQIDIDTADSDAFWAAVFRQMETLPLRSRKRSCSEPGGLFSIAVDKRRNRHHRHASQIHRSFRQHQLRPLTRSRSEAPCGRMARAF